MSAELVKNPQMLAGGEMEYSVSEKRRNGVIGPLNPGLVPRILMCRPSDMQAMGYANNQFWRNGFRLYDDHGLLEVSGPECESPEAAAVTDRAGEIIIAKLLYEATERGILEGFVLNKRVLNGRQAIDGEDRMSLLRAAAAGYSSCGSHSSHGMEGRKSGVQITPEALELDLLWKATRCLFLGAGGVVTVPDQGVKQSSFTLYQKAIFICQDYSSDTIHRRGLVNTRDEPLAKEPWVRVHDASADANIAPWAVRMTKAIGGVVLKMIDAGMEAPLHLRWHGGTRLMNAAAFDMTHTQEVDAFEDDEVRRPLDIQWMLHGMSLKLCERMQLSTEELWAIQEWGRVLADLELQNPRLLIDRVDWAAKLIVLLNPVKEKYGIEEDDWRGERLVAADRRYDELASSDNGGKRTIPEILRAKIWAKYDFDPEAVTAAVEGPPSGRRAAQRGEFIQMHGYTPQEQRIRGDLPESINWGQGRADINKSKGISKSYVKTVTWPPF